MSAGATPLINATALLVIVAAILALGITPVHVNRVLRELDREGLIERRTKRYIRIPDWEALRRIGGFNELYLHLDQGVAA